MPLVKPPQDYSADRRRAAAGGQLRSGRTRADGQAERRRLREERRRSAPATSRSCTGPTRSANSEGLFAYYRYAEASFILTCRTPDGTGSGWAGTTGLKDISQIDAAALTEIAADKALKSRKPKALEPGNYTVILEPRPAARFLSLMLVRAQRARRRGRPQLHERQGARHDQARPEDLRRQRHDPQRRRQRRAAADAGRPGWARRRARSPGSKRASSRTSFYDRFWAKKQDKAVHADAARSRAW